MNNLYIINKQEFTSLYRFGEIPLNLNKIIDTTDLDLKEIHARLINGFMEIPYFVGDEEYLIISFENKLSRNNWLEIERVHEIIPLTAAAKQSYEMKFDSKLNFQKARFEQVTMRVEELIDMREMHRGAKAFFQLCNGKGEPTNFVDDLVLEKSYDYRITGKKSNEIKEDFLIHLLTYDRYDFFPNNDFGFFYDVGEVFANSKGHTSFKNSNLWKYFEENKAYLGSEKLNIILSTIEEESRISTFKTQLTVDNNRLYIAAVFFLYFKSQLKSVESISETDIIKQVNWVLANTNYKNEIELAVFLTGAFFKYSKFYDDLYSHKGLSIFKNEKKTQELGTLKENISPIKLVENEESIEIVITEEELNHSTEPNESNPLLRVLMNLLEESKGEFEIKGKDKIDLMKNTLKSLNGNKKPNNRDVIIDIINDNFSEFLVAKKYSFRRKT